MSDNKYGLDTTYQLTKLSILLRDIENYKPDECARTLLRLAMVADENVINEPEFNKVDELLRKQRETCLDAYLDAIPSDMNTNMGIQEAILNAKLENEK